MVAAHARIEPTAAFKALSDPTRRALFEQLCRKGELTVHVLTDFSGVSQPAVSKHLGQLSRAGLVHKRAEGRETHYRANPQGLAPLMNWLAYYTAFWNERLDKLENLLDRMDQ